jgi:transcriptional regulator with XRE-family HTH domain
MTETFSHKALNSVLIKTIGQRLREARELCGYTQVKAAMLMGYQNSSKLAKIELASDTKSVPVWMILRAAEVYGVSINFLFGLTDAPQFDPKAALQAQTLKAIEQSQSSQNNAIRQVYSLISTIESAVSANLKRSAEFKELVLRFRQLNPEFDEMRLGAKLLHVAAEANREADKILQQLTDYHNSIKN